MKKPKNGIGEDNIFIKIPKERGEIALQYLSSKYPHQEEIPIDWANALVILIYKKGNKETLKNYHPPDLQIVLTDNNQNLACISRKIKLHSKRATIQLNT